MITLLVSLVVAQQTGPTVIPPEYRGGIPSARAWDFVWTDGPWKAPDPRYVAFRRQVDALGRRSVQEPSAGREILRLALREREAARKSRWDPLAAFRHDYAAYMALQVAPGPANWGEVGMAEAVDRFRILHFPGQPEYARAMFLNDSVPMPQPVRRRLGKRLFAHDPDDRRVLHVLINISRPEDPLERADTIKLANELIKRWPDYSGGYTVRGGMYFTSFFTDHRRKGDGLLAIKDFREYLSRVPTRDPSRKGIEEHISYIQSQLKRP